jgi:hypothetical protein
MKTFRFTLLLSALALCTGTSLVAADAPKYTIKEVMKTLHKGDDNIAKHVLQGKGTKDEINQLVEYYQSLPQATPKQGDIQVWKQKATALYASAKALQAGQPNALAAYKQAANCKECHKLFKPDPKR